MDPRNIYLSEEAPTFENLASGLYYRLQTLRQENNRQERLGGEIPDHREINKRRRSLQDERQVQVSQWHGHNRPQPQNQYDGVEVTTLRRASTFPMAAPETWQKSKTVMSSSNAIPATTVVASSSSRSPHTFFTRKILPAGGILPIRKKYPKTKGRASCDVCHASLSSKDNLRRHQRGLQDNECPSTGCNRTFCTLKMLERHHEERHPLETLNLEAKYNCPLEGCSFSFKRKSTLREHVRDHSSKDLSCPHCSQRFSVYRDRVRHLEGLDVWKCRVDKCDKAFCTENRLREHYKSHKGKEYKRPKNLLWCEICQKKFPTSRTLLVDSKRHEPQQKKPRVMAVSIP